MAKAIKSLILLASKMVGATGIEPVAPTMGSKGDRQDVLRVWASTGFHPASPGPALMSATGSMTGLPAGSLRTLLTIDVSEPVAASLGRSTIRRERRPYAVSSWGLIGSVG